MELIEFFNLIKKHLVVFIVIFLIVFFGGLIWHDKETKLYQASVTINLSREGQLEILDYQYDQFYRLQADEKFGKNVVSWVGDPGLMAAIKESFIGFEKGSWSDISRIKTKQLASSYIKVEFKSKTSQSAIVFGEALGRTLDKKTQQLNIQQAEKKWFKLIIDKTQVVKNDVNTFLVLLSFSCFGILLGVFGVLIIYYFSENENRN